MKFIRSVIERLVKREPVLFFGVIGLWATATWEIEPDSRVGLALAGTVLLFQRAYTEAKVTSEEKVEEAKYVGAVENQAITSAGAEIARVERVRSRPLQSSR